MGSEALGEQPTQPLAGGGCREQYVSIRSLAMGPALKPGEVLLLENLRFEKGEKKGDSQFAAAVAQYADAY